MTTRLEKAKALLKEGNYKIIDDNTIQVKDYKVSLNSCTCIDHRIRKLNCKHILMFQLLKQEQLQSVNYMKLDDPIQFEHKYGIRTLAYLKSVGDVFEIHNQLKWT